MGIRYYAYPIDAALVDVARASPRQFMSRDPLLDAWGPVDERPPMLYLDKCWREFQLLFGDFNGRTPRPALALVEGYPVMHSEGWDSHIAVLDADQVAEVGTDLGSVTEDDVREMLTPDGGAYPQDGFDGELGYVMQYLRAAQEFTALVAGKGQGLVYLIG